MMELPDRFRIWILISVAWEDLLKGQWITNLSIKLPIPQGPVLSLEEIINGINSNDSSKQVMATQGARKMLSRERNPPIDAIIEAGMVAPLIRFLDREDK